MFLITRCVRRFVVIQRYGQWHELQRSLPSIILSTATDGLDGPEPRATFCSYTGTEFTELLFSVDANCNVNTASPSSGRLGVYVAAFP